MKIVNLVQGTPAWHEHRSKHFNASDAPAMLGISPYKTRSQLLKERATGIAQDVDDATQRRFNDGHRFEALARPLAEKIIGEELSPVTGTEGKYSASFDGITFDGDMIFEHKSMNNDIRDALFNGASLGIAYRAQMEHQLMVSSAKKCLFMASTFDPNDELVEEMHCWYEPDMVLRQRIIDGWEQFEKDLAAYVPEEVKEMPKAEVTIELPALFVHAKGEITTHNMEEFGKALTTKLAEVRAIALVTDQDFSNAKEAAKKFRETAKAIAMSKEQMLAQTETIGEAARKMDAWAKDLNATALQLEKDVEREDKAKKEVMVLAGKTAYAEHVVALEAEIQPIRLNLVSPNFAEAIKGKRNYTSMQDAVDTMLATAKIDADAQAKDVRAKLAWCKENAKGHSSLFPDLQQIISKPMEDFTLTITSRIDKAKAEEAAKLEAVRAQAEAEAKAKAEREAAAKMAEEEARIRAEEQAKARAEAESRAKEIADQQRALDAEEDKVIGVDLASQPDRTEVRFVQVDGGPSPTRAGMVAVIAQHYGVSAGLAEKWLQEAFSA